MVQGAVVWPGRGSENAANVPTAKIEKNAGTKNAITGKGRSEGSACEGYYAGCFRWIAQRRQSMGRTLHERGEVTGVLTAPLVVVSYLRGIALPGL